MKPMEQLRRTWRALFGKGRLDARMDEEMRLHVELQTRENIEAGMKPEEARYAALRQFGWAETIKETCRDQRPGAWIEGGWRDFKFALRQLARKPGFAFVAIGTLALCLGANLTIFAVVDAILLRPLPFPDSERLVTVFNSYPKAGVERDGGSLPNYYERRGNIEAFSSLSLLQFASVTVGEPGATEQVPVARVTPEFFGTLGVGPVLGRVFEDDEMTYQNDKLAILTDGYWREHFAADPGVIGKKVRVDGYARTVVGVLPPGFRFLSSKARLYLPLSSNPDDRIVLQRHSGNGYEMIARLRPGVTIQEGQSQIDAHNAAHASEYPQAKMIADAGFRSVVASLRGDHVKAVTGTLLLMQAGGLLLLLIGAINLVNLLLIRAAGRTRELAIRVSLGAGRGLVARQVVVEILTLAVSGGVFGLALGAVGIRMLGAFGVSQLPLGATLDLSWRLGLVALAGSVACGLGISFPLTWFSVRGQPADALQSEARGGVGGLAAQRLRHGFIVAQIALAFVLLSGAGLLGLSLRKVLSVAPGFRAEHVLTGQVNLPWKGYPDWPRRLGLIHRLVEEAATQPGVVAAGVINNVPFSGNNGKSAFVVQGHIRQPGESLRGHYYYGVGGNAFAVLGIPLREGRFIGEEDAERRVCVVDEEFARLYWPRGGAIGGRVFQGSEEGEEANGFTVVGVVGAVKQAGLTENSDLGAVYVPFQYRTDADFYALIRTRQAPEAFGLSLRKLVRGLDPELPVDDLRSMETRIADSLVARRSPALLASVFALVALMLAAIGTYGVLSYAVAQRRREIGVRMALGALAGQIRGQFLSVGMRLLGAGLGLGLLGAWLAGQALQGLLYGVPALHPATLAATAVIMGVVALTACWLPARRASRVDPMVVLRDE